MAHALRVYATPHERRHRCELSGDGINDLDMGIAVSGSYGHKFTSLGNNLAHAQMLRSHMDFLSSKPRLLCIVSTLLLLGAVGSVRCAYAQENRGRQGAANSARQSGSPNAGEVHVLPVQGNISMLVGAGGNITVQAGEDGILLVDSGVAAMSSSEGP